MPSNICLLNSYAHAKYIPPVTGGTVAHVCDYCIKTFSESSEVSDALINASPIAEINVQCEFGDCTNTNHEEDGTPSCNIIRILNKIDLNDLAIVSPATNHGEALKHISLDNTDNLQSEIDKLGEHEQLLMKHLDCTIVFTVDTDAKLIYASDVDEPEIDLFADCRIVDEFKNVLIGHYGDKDLTSLKKVFSNLDPEYGLSDFVNMGDVPISELFS